MNILTSKRYDLNWNENTKNCICAITIGANYYTLDTWNNNKSLYELSDKTDPANIIHIEVVQGKTLKEAQSNAIQQIREVLQAAINSISKL